MNSGYYLTPTLLLNADYAFSKGIFNLSTRVFLWQMHYMKPNGNDCPWYFISAFIIKKHTGNTGKVSEEQKFCKVFLLTHMFARGGDGRPIVRMAILCKLESHRWKAQWENDIKMAHRSMRYSHNHSFFFLAETFINERMSPKYIFVKHT